MKKKCSKCGALKELKEFSPSIGIGSRKDGKKSQCKKCRCKAQKLHYLKYKNQIKTRNTQFYIENREKIRKSHQQYRENSREKINRRKREYKKEQIQQFPGIFKERQRKERKTLANVYVKDIITKVFQLKKSEITLEMIQLEREQIMVHRELKSLKEELKNERANGYVQ